MMTMTVMIKTCSGKFCRETMSLTHPTGMISQILVRGHAVVFGGNMWNTSAKRLRFSMKSASKTILSFLPCPLSPVTIKTCICILAKSLVASLMEVDQDQRLTAQEAISHEWWEPPLNIWCSLNFAPWLQFGNVICLWGNVFLFLYIHYLGYLGMQLLTRILKTVCALRLKRTLLKQSGR